MTYTHYAGQRGINYTDTETYTETNGQGRNRDQDPHGDPHHLVSSRGRGRSFLRRRAGVRVKESATNKVSQLAPWDTSGDLVNFKADISAACKTERYAVLSGSRKGSTKRRTSWPVRSKGFAARTSAATSRSSTRCTTQHVGVTFKHILLPIWLASYRYYDKAYHILVKRTDRAGRRRTAVES